MPTLEIYISELVTVSDVFGTIMVAIKRWAENIFLTEAEPDEEDEPAPEPEEEEDNKAPPTLGIVVGEVVRTNDIFGK